MLWEAAAKSFELDMQTFSQLNKAPVVMGRLCKVFQHRLCHERGVSSGPELHKMVSGEKAGKAFAGCAPSVAFPQQTQNPGTRHNTATLRAGGRAREAKAAEENLDPGFKNLQCFLNVHCNSSHGWSRESKSDLFASALSLALENWV